MFFVENEDPILNPTLWIGNFEWREPVTTLTDFLTALVCFYAFYHFNNYKGEQSSSFVNYKFYFLFFAIGMTSAAWFGHGLQAYVGFEWKIIGWVMSATALLSMEIGSIKELRNLIPNKIISLLQVLFVIQYIVMVTLMVSSKNFVIPQLNSTISLILFVIPIQLIAYIRTKQKGHAYIFGAIIYGALPGLIYNNQISISKWFNYHDISHVLMAIFMFIIFKGTSNISFLKR
ncbi:MAG: hypothetical protein N4A35_00590 [Flavobacteriales bacterium]|jgi:hypothetical protein|nr:hypothetical protein [Flavobacteriales bacterium]